VAPDPLAIPSLGSTHDRSEHRLSAETCARRRSWPVHPVLLRNEEFLRILANKRGSQIDAILGNENLKKILEEVIRLVDAEFEDSQQ
jgi:hypothetical protein